MQTGRLFGEGETFNVVRHVQTFNRLARLTLQTIQKNGWELLSHPSYSPDLAPSDYHLFGPLKYHLRGHYYDTDEAVQEAVRSCLRGAGTDFYRRGIFKILTEVHRSGWRFSRKVITNSQILLTFIFVCIPSFHRKVNELVTFATSAYMCLKHSALKKYLDPRRVN
jgi:hypothetical protein